MSKRKKLMIIASSALAIISLGLYLTAAIVSGTNSQNQQEALASAKASCALDPQTFMSTVNQWRATTGAPALTYSAQLEAGANARIADMIQGQYYGHTNPTTKEQSYTMVMKSDTAATTEDEVLDAPLRSSDSLTNFKNSPEHYNALINPAYHYFASVAIYQPESWAEYDNDGSLQAPVGTYSPSCLVVGELADASGDATPSAPVKSFTGAKSSSSYKPAVTLKAPTWSISPPSPVPTVPGSPVCDTGQKSQVGLYYNGLAEDEYNLHNQNAQQIGLAYAGGSIGQDTFNSQMNAENSRDSGVGANIVSSYLSALKQINC